jgi:hypothetical protein
MALDENAIREMWLNIAKTAADHRRIVGAGDEVFYGDLTLRNSATAHAWGEMTRAIRRAIEAGVGEDEILDALLSGDPHSDLAETIELIKFVRIRDERVTELNAQLLRRVLGDGD